MAHPFFAHGQQRAIAHQAGISASSLGDILHRRRNAGWQLALRLEYASLQILGREIRAREWYRAQYTDHPAFVGPRARPAK
ncbi:MAG TPA: hypothetical protein VLI39_07535 [Sedimentisphaerales bacterium]|nr:hypothetical protein [Sedimentisphaerales bacterium]